MKRRVWGSFVLLLVAAWCVMLLTHELGHVVAGWAGGATLVDADLAPWRLPYSVHQPDPYPLATLWGGPILGIAMPYLLAWLGGRRWLVFIADFCLLANGVYLALAWFSGDPLLDTARLLRAGAHPASVAIFCLVTVPWGYIRFRADCVAWLTVATGDAGEPAD